MAEARSDDLWALVDVGRAPSRGRAIPLRWVVSATPILVLTSALAMAVLLPRGLEQPARLSLFAFGLAVILWSLSKINAAYIALGAALILVLGGAIEQEDLFEALESDVIWLIIGAFVLGAAVQSTGLAGRLTATVSRRARDVGQMMWLAPSVLLMLAFLIPSTSGRAAVAIPVFRSLSDAVDDAKVTRALALLMPTVILVSTIASLVGAASHLIANDLLDEVADVRISFVDWLLYGVPFAVVATYASTFVVGRMFLSAEGRRRKLTPPNDPRRPLSRDETVTLGLIVAMVGLWLTEGLHGLEIATVSVLGAFALTLPGFGVLSWKEGLKAVSWNLVVFVGMALVLGEALIDTEAAPWLIDNAFRLTGVADGGPILLILLALVLITLTSHLYMTSHAARASALVPPLLFLADRLDINAAAVVFIGTVGMNYCLTFPVSSKALLMFQELDRDTWRPADLLKLSAVLLPVHAVLMVAFYYGWWRHVGLAF